MSTKTDLKRFKLSSTDNYEERLSAPIADHLEEEPILKSETGYFERSIDWAKNNPAKVAIFGIGLMAVKPRIAIRLTRLVLSAQALSYAGKFLNAVVDENMVDFSKEYH